MEVNDPAPILSPLLRQCLGKAEAVNISTSTSTLAENNPMDHTMAARERFSRYFSSGRSCDNADCCLCVCLYYKGTDTPGNQKDKCRSLNLFMGGRKKKEHTQNNVTMF